MKRIELALFAAALLLQSPTVLAYDRPAPEDAATVTPDDAAAPREAARPSMEGATRTDEAKEIPDGAASMEPGEAGSDEERSERTFVENVWNSP